MLGVLGKLDEGLQPVGPRPGSKRFPERHGFGKPASAPQPPGEQHGKFEAQLLIARCRNRALQSLDRLGVHRAGLKDPGQAPLLDGVAELRIAGAEHRARERLSERDQRTDILGVVIDDRDHPVAPDPLKVIEVKLGDEPSFDVRDAHDPQDLALDGRQAAIGKSKPPKFSRGIEQIEVNLRKRRLAALKPPSRFHERDVETLAVIRHEGLGLAQILAHELDERFLFGIILHEVLIEHEDAAHDPADPDQEDISSGPSSQTGGLGVDIGDLFGIDVAPAGIARQHGEGFGEFRA